MYVEYNHAMNRFFVDKYDFEDEPHEILDKYEELTSILNELINDMPIEFNDLQFLCNEYSVKDNSFPYLYMNQHIVKEKICEHFNIR